MEEGKWDAWVWVKWKPGAPANAWKQWNMGNVKGCWSITGHWDCQLWIAVENMSELEDFVWNNLRTNEWVEDTETQWVKEWAKQLS